MFGMAVRVCRRKSSCHIVEPATLQLKRARSMCMLIVELVYVMHGRCSADQIRPLHAVM